MNAPLFKGHAIVLAGVALVMPALSFGGIETTKELMRQIDAGEITDVVELQRAFIAVLHAALQRNHPDLPREVLVNGLDWDSAIALYQKLLQMSFPQGPAAGETKVGSPSGASIGS